MEPQKRKTLLGAQLRQQKREKEVKKEKMEGSFMKFLGKLENKETECQEDIEVALTSTALNQEAMDVTQEKDIRPSEGESSKTREDNPEEPVSSLSSSVI
ncbi:hypothetical protein EVAR_4002_1 [Eumeta japonica]|uniref:Uncharacterized protein n=1 Tax=Eumeta variegata TaxID=151549 RepID=A0A4C1T693_EUMVA|nr:hypothetical protein EVAR_4002_1 [Eumeta japonica]